MKKFYFLLLLQITLLTFVSFGQGFTNRQVYNFNVGDIIQRRDIAGYQNSNYGIFTYLQDTIITKRFSTNHDSIIYTVFHRNYNYDNTGHGSSNTASIIILAIGSLDSIAIGSGISDCGAFAIMRSAIDTQYRFVDNQFCSDSAFYIQSKNWGEGYETATFHKGLGDADFHYSDGSCGDIENCQVIYSRKSGVECGSKYAFPNVGIEDIRTNTINIYPNPTITTTTITLTKPINNATIQLINLTGQIVLEKTNQTGNHFTLDISQQAAGIYFVEIKQADKVWRSKVVKQ